MPIARRGEPHPLTFDIRNDHQGDEPFTLRAVARLAADLDRRDGTRVTARPARRWVLKEGLQEAGVAVHALCEERQSPRAATHERMRVVDRYLDVPDTSPAFEPQEG